MSKEIVFERVAVGEKVSDRIINFISYGNEGCIIDFMSSGALGLYVFMPNITTKEIENVRCGQIKYKIAQIYNTIFFCFKFGELNWMDCPYNFELTRKKNDLLPFPTFENGYGLGVIIYLIDSSTMCMQAIRMIGLHTKASNKLFNYIENQRQSAWDHDKSIEKDYSRMSAKDIADRAFVGGRI